MRTCQTAGQGVEGHVSQALHTLTMLEAMRCIRRHIAQQMGVEDMPSILLLHYSSTSSS